MKKIINYFKTLTKKQKTAVIVFIIGLITLIAGSVFLILKVTNKPSSPDGDYLVSAKNWTLEDEDSVIWDFTEIGKGTLTTNNHKNDYDFIWALEDGKLKIETNWAYELEDEYDYQLDQKSGTLTLTNDDTSVTFKANFEN